ncbi:hypothetical protein NSPZN2_100124 [Nitrospira defluvii]|uniref:Uncharacterized protein n=1 Tax=Nitrospira defluvii TaxID=330214 RepID=A0ABM8R0G0_9BACT|nr:hypothetical protein NSPZN2_100124 [Nitrospira defluvii]
MGFSHLSGSQRTARVRLVPSFAAALLDGHFEHPVKGDSCCALRVGTQCFDELTVICSKLLNNFKKLANAFLYCQGNRRLTGREEETAADASDEDGRFLDFHLA